MGRGTTLPMKNSTTLNLSLDYLRKEKVVESWVFMYVGRNRIPIRKVFDYRWNREILQLDFSSRWQMMCFASNGNREFPYFEFL